jgi:hypothetical protein
MLTRSIIQSLRLGAFVDKITQDLHVRYWLHGTDKYCAAEND